jgi:hypothetical protein
MKNDINRKSFKLNEISINYEKLRELYVEVKIEKEKTHENFIKLNQENFELKRELANKNNLDLSNNFINKSSNFPKANIESEINLRINTTNISSSDRIFNFNSKSSERNNIFINNNIKYENKKSAEYITDSSYNFSNNNVFKRVTSPYRIDDEEKNLIDDLKLSKNLLTNKMYGYDSNNNDIKNFHEEIFSANINNNDFNNLELINIKNNAPYVNNKEYNERSNSFQSSNVLLSKNFSPKNFLINFNPKDNQRGENFFKENLFKSDSSFKVLEKANEPEVKMKILDRPSSKRDNLEKNDFLSKNSDFKSKITKEKSPKKEVSRKSPKPPNTKVNISHNS